MNKGYLEIVVGPMWAGKTSDLMKTYKKLKESPNISDKDILTLNYIGDVRYGKDAGICSHDGLHIPCRWASMLSDISKEHYQNAKYILINEGQFFKDIVQWVITAIEKDHKYVYICGLDCDFRRQPFGNWLDLICHANCIRKLKATCHICGSKEAIYSDRLSGETMQIMVGTDEYQVLCRECYVNKHL